MLKKQSKAICLAMAIVFCLAFIAVAPPAAQAVSTYSALRTEVLPDVNGYLTQPKIAIQVDDVASLNANDVVTIHLPSGLEMNNPGGTTGNEFQNPKVAFSYGSSTLLAVDLINTPPTNPAAATFSGTTDDNIPITGPNVRVDAPATLPDGTTSNAFAAAGSYVAYPVGKSAIEIKAVAPPASGKGILYVSLNHVKVTDTLSGDVSATIVAPATSGFSSGSVVFAKGQSGNKGTVTLVKSVKSFSDGNLTLDTIMLQETVKGSLSANEVIQLKLPSGFKWVDTTADYTIKGGWGYTGMVISETTTPDTADKYWIADDRTLKVKMPASLSAATEGRIYFDGLTIAVADESVAKKGEVVLNISSNGNVTEQDLTVAKYVDYGVTVSEGTVKEVLAGWGETELGSFNIKEGIAGSLIPNRTIKLTLPSGVKWDDSSGVTTISHKCNSGTDWWTGSNIGFDSSKRVMTITLPNTIADASDMTLEKLKVKISPEYTGDIVVEVSGTAGASGKVKVATVKPAITLSAEKVSDIVIGVQEQAIGDVTIKENDKEAILPPSNSVPVRELELKLPDGATFAQLPTVTVTEGDITIDKIAYGKTKQSVVIIAKSSSTKASTLKLSNIKVTVNRTVPEGDFVLSVVAPSAAITDQAETFNVSTITSAVIGKCITPAPTETEKVGQFNIGSNIYYVNGAAKLMDVAPYIKAGRTYVPVRYLGYALGLTDDQIKWDAATQTVTFTKGSDSVSVVIGSKTLTKNGAATTMDVAPEIKNGRTMLPARWIAEAFGAQVGWNPATQTVLIQSAVK